MKLKVLGLLFCIMLLAGLVSAQSSVYHVQGKHNDVFITLDDNGTGYATDGVRSVGFNWNKVTNGYEAKYWFWTVPFMITGNKLVSPSFPEDVAVLVK